MSELSGLRCLVHLVWLTHLKCLTSDTSDTIRHFRHFRKSVKLLMWRTGLGLVHAKKGKKNRTGPDFKTLPLTLLIKHDLDAPIYILSPLTRPDSCNRHRKVSNALPEPNRSRPTRTAIPLLFPIGRIPFFSGLLGLVPCALAFPHSGVHSHQTLGVL